MARTEEISQPVSPYDFPVRTHPEITVLLAPSISFNADDALLSYFARLAQHSYLSIYQSVKHSSTARAHEFGLLEAVIESRVAEVVLRLDDQDPTTMQLVSLDDVLAGSAVEPPPDAGIDYALVGNVICDFVVGSEAAIGVVPLHLRQRRYCSLRELNEYLRLVQVAYDYLEPVPGLLVDRFMYYRHRYLLLYPATVNLPHRRYNYTGVTDRIESLQRRLDLLLRAVDKTLIASLQTPTSNSLDEASYSCSMLIMAMTGSFDDIAEAIRADYQFSLPVTRVTLAAPARGASDFAKAVRRHNHELADYLTEPSTVEALKAIYEIRHQVQHREFPAQVGHSHSSLGSLPGSLLLPGKAALALANWVGDASFRPEWLSQDDGEALVELFWLAQTLLASHVRLVNRVLELWTGTPSSGRAPADTWARNEFGGVPMTYG